MPSVVATCWGPTPIGDVPYWHLAAPSPFFYKTVKAGMGGLLSLEAAIAAHDPSFCNPGRPRPAIVAPDLRESIFEEVRQALNPKLPSRLKSLHVFDDHALVERALKERSANEQQASHECRLIEGSVIHKADAAWLNADESQWRESAEKYWHGLMTHTPFPEILVLGAVYFPDWQGFPAQ
jgi:hypothetical protein